MKQPLTLWTKYEPREQKVSLAQKHVHEYDNNLLTLHLEQSLGKAQQHI